MRRDAHGSAGGQAFGCRHRTMNGSGRKRTGAATTLGLAFVLLAYRASAQSLEPFPLPRTTFGSVGMVEMPSARMAPDGELSLSTSFSKNLQRYNLGFQALPWLNFTFRYSLISHLPLDPFLHQYADRSFGLRIRLLREGRYQPSISVGLRDIAGTGLYSAEYLVATKRIFPNLDATVGIGWGRLATADPFPNPLGYLSQSFRTRVNNVGFGGTVSFSSFFHGANAGIFGGIVWRSPIKHLSAAIEYSSDRYNLESSYGAFVPNGQINIGIQYDLSNSVQIGAKWLYNNSFGFTLTFLENPKENPFKSTLSPKPVPTSIRTESEQLNALRLLAEPIQTPTRRLTAWPIQHRTSIRQFASALFKVPNLQTIRLQGRNLIIVTRSRPSKSECNSIAESASQQLGNVASVTLSSHLATTMVCRPQATPEPTTSISEIAIDQPIGSGPELPRDRSQVKKASLAIRQDGAEQLLFIDAVGMTTSTLTVYYENGTYGSAADAAGRLLRILLKDAPPNIERFRMISMVDGLPVQQYDVSRSSIERDLQQHNGRAALLRAIKIHAPSPHPAFFSLAETLPYPRFTWSLAPSLRESFFDPHNPLRLGVLAVLGGEFRPTPNLSFDATLDANIWNNLAQAVPSNSLLPHVRSDFSQYYKYGATGISSLMASYRWRVAPDITALVKAGYLESMFGGFGGEVLWHPERSRFAVGFDLYQVWQRNFDRLFGFQKYNVLTGHVALYYQSPWYGLNFRLLAGRYLAGDAGYTVEITRRFSTGVEIGAFATFTNVSAAQFGEGSFDKGIIIRIPFDWVLPVPTQSQFTMDLRPVTRDGGQRLSGDTTLYNTLQRENYGVITRDWRSIYNP